MNSYQLCEDVKIDATFVGGKNKNRHKNKKVEKCQGRSFKDKAPIFRIYQRGGKLVKGLFLIPEPKPFQYYASMYQPRVECFPMAGTIAI